MSRRLNRLLPLLLAGLSGCHHHDVTSELDANGNVQTRMATSSEVARLEAEQAKNDVVDRRYPRPEIPKGVTPIKAVRVSPPGIVELADARRIRLDGVTCDQIGVAFLSRLLIGPETSLLVVPTAQVSDQPIASDVWTVEELDGGAIGYSFPVEDALKNGWCDVEPNSTSKRRDRYAAIVVAFSKERHDFGNNAR